MLISVRKQKKRKKKKKFQPAIQGAIFGPLCGVSAVMIGCTRSHRAHIFMIISDKRRFCDTVELSQFSMHRLVEQVAQLSQRDRAAVWVSYGQNWKTGTGRQYFADIISLSSTTVT